MEQGTRIEPPVYLAGAAISCWVCGEDMPVVALLAPNVPEITEEVCVLSDITELPASVLSFIQEYFPGFRKTCEEATQSEGYVNTCPQCGAVADDFYLHSEPDSVFFPVSEEETESLTLREVPLRSSFLMRGGIGMGVGDLILENARRLTE